MTTPQSDTPRAKAISEAINATLKPYAEKYFSTATAMLLIGQFLEISKIERELGEASDKLTTITTDKDYVGGTQYWISQHDKVAIELARLIPKYMQIQQELSQVRGELENFVTLFDGAQASKFRDDISVNKLNDIVTKIKHGRMLNLIQQDSGQ